MQSKNQNAPTRNVVTADKYKDNDANANAMAKQPVNVGMDVT